MSITTSLVFKGWSFRYTRADDEKSIVDVCFALSHNEIHTEVFRRDMQNLCKRWESKNPGWTREGIMIPRAVSWNPYIITVYDAHTSKRQYRYLECAVSDDKALLNQQEWDTLISVNKDILYRYSEEMSYMEYMPTDKLKEFLNECRKNYYDYAEAGKYASHAHTLVSEYDVDLVDHSIPTIAATDATQPPTQ
jgi:hypothetical protein